jgi:hypothetical protein
VVKKEEKEEDVKVNTTRLKLLAAAREEDKAETQYRILNK